MEQVVIENPTINSPFEEPERHFRFTEDGVTNEIVEARRVSSYFIPVPRPKKKSKQQQITFATEWKEERIKENEFINQVRARVAKWRQGGYPINNHGGFGRGAFLEIDDPWNAKSMIRDFLKH